MYTEEPIRLYAAVTPPIYARQSGRYILFYAAASLALFASLILSVFVNSRMEERAAAAVTADPILPWPVLAPTRVTVALSPGDKLMRLPYTPVVNRKYHMFLSNPAAICAALGQKTGSRDAAWGPAPIEANGWECLIGPVKASMEPAQSGDSSLFIIMRGPSLMDSTQFSLILNLARPADDKGIMRLAIGLLSQTEFPEIALPTGAVPALAAKHVFKWGEDGDKVEIAVQPKGAAKLRLVARFAPLRPEALLAAPPSPMKDLRTFHFGKAAAPAGAEQAADVQP